MGDSANLHAPFALYVACVSANPSWPCASAPLAEGPVAPEEVTTNVCGLSTWRGAYLESRRPHLREVVPQALRPMIVPCGMEDVYVSALQQHITEKV